MRGKRVHEKNGVVSGEFYGGERTVIVRHIWTDGAKFYIRYNGTDYTVRPQANREWELGEIVGGFRNDYENRK